MFPWCRSTFLRRNTESHKKPFANIRLFYHANKSDIFWKVGITVQVRSGNIASLFPFRFFSRIFWKLRLLYRCGAATSPPCSPRLSAPCPARWRTRRTPTSSASTTTRPTPPSPSTRSWNCSRSSRPAADSGRQMSSSAWSRQGGVPFVPSSWSYPAVLGIREIFVRIWMRIWDAQKHTDPTDPDPDADPEHW